MPKKIQDEFTGRTDISRQRKWQLRKRRQGRCMICGRPAVTSLLCARHSVELAKQQKRRRGGRWTGRGRWLSTLPAEAVQEES